MISFLPSEVVKEENLLHNKEESFYEPNINGTKPSATITSVLSKVNSVYVPVPEQGMDSGCFYLSAHL